MDVDRGMNFWSFINGDADLPCRFVFYDRHDTGVVDPENNQETMSVSLVDIVWMQI